MNQLTFLYKTVFKKICVGYMSVKTGLNMIQRFKINRWVEVQNIYNIFWEKVNI